MSPHTGRRNYKTDGRDSERIITITITKSYTNLSRSDTDCRMFFQAASLLALIQLSLSCNVPDLICPDLQNVQDEIVNLHNMFRSEVSPPASNMLKMNWSEEVAQSAQNWVNTCAMKHGPPSARMYGTYQMGENLFSSTDLVSWSEVVSAWHSEVADYSYPVGSANGNAIGHYTQVVWFGSYMIGCSVAKCEEVYFYGCQYYRAGNFRRTPPYAEGEPCAACPDSCEGKLCTNTCPYINIFANCPTLKALGSCGDYMLKFCEAECLCENEIIPFN